MKRDINLIPRNDNPPIFTKYVLPIFLLLVLYASAAYIGWSIPTENLHKKETEDTLLAQKVADLAYVEDDYKELRAQINAIEAKQATIAQTTSKVKSVDSILEIIEEACPEDLVILSMEINEDGLVLEGYSYSNTTIAEFVVNMRNVDRFNTVNIQSVTPKDVSFADVQQAQVDGVEIDELRAFSITVSYKSDSELASEEGDE